jgi:hypothetical protein
MGRSCRKLAALIVATSCLMCSALSAQSGSASLCVAPNSAEPAVRCAPGLCGSGEISLKIDDRPILPWPKVESMKIIGLDAAGKHRVVIYRAGKPQQSFQFSDFKSNSACLFLNDLYWTAQLWDPQHAPVVQVQVTPGIG